jgi:hypothetical protein
VPPLACRSGAALRLRQTCHSCAMQHFRKASDRHADFPDLCTRSYCSRSITLHMQ